MKYVKLTNRNRSIIAPPEKKFGFRERQIFNNLTAATVTQDDPEHYIVEFLGTWTDGSERTFEYDYKQHKITN